MTPEEISILTQFRSDIDMLWAGPDLINQELLKVNNEGVTTFINRPVQFPLPEVKSMFPMDEAIAMENFLSSPEGKGVKFYLDGLENPDINHPTFGQLLGYLATVVNVVSMDSVINILNLGKRMKTKSEVLFNRQLTTEEIKQGIIDWEMNNA